MYVFFSFVPLELKRNNSEMCSVFDFDGVQQLYAWYVCTKISNTTLYIWIYRVVF